MKKLITFLTILIFAFSFTQSKFEKYNFTKCEVTMYSRINSKFITNLYDTTGTVLINREENYYVVKFIVNNEIFDLKLYFVKNLKDLNGKNLRMERRVDDDGNFYNTNSDLKDDSTTFHLSPLDNTVDYQRTFILKR